MCFFFFVSYRVLLSSYIVLLSSSYFRVSILSHGGRYLKDGGEGNRGVPLLLFLLLSLPLGLSHSSRALEVRSAF